MEDVPLLKCKNKFRIDVVNSRKQLGCILNDWETLQLTEDNPVPSVDPHHYINELDSMGKMANPYILCLYEGSKPLSMLIGRSEKSEFPMRIGYKCIIKPCLRKIHIFHGGLIGNKSYEVCSFLFMFLRTQLNIGKADLAVFNHIRCESSLFNTIRKNPPFLGITMSPRIDGHWGMRIPSSLEDFYLTKSAKERQTLRRKVRKLEKMNGVFLKVYINEGNLNEGMIAAASISGKTYQYALESGFQNNRQMRNFLVLAAKRGWLRLYVLFINSEAIAYQWGILYGRTFFLRTLGFDPKWKDYSVGTVLFMKALEAISAEKSIINMDFGFGDAEWKKSYANWRHSTRSIYVYSKRLYPKLLYVLHSFLNRIWVFAIFLSQKTKIERTLKRRWRDYLIKKI